MALNIVLVEPEIPHNTGSIARTSKGQDSIIGHLYS
jgi:tRNA(Leu) C34 or U34 (ribose-2'-O)-methylase TrmL